MVHGTSTMRATTALAVSLILSAPGWTAEPPSAAEREMLLKKGAELNTEAVARNEAGKPTEALRLGKQALELRERLFPADQYPDGHADLVQSLNNVGMFLQALGEHRQALPFLEKALAMNERLYPPDKHKDGHPAIAESLNKLCTLLIVLEDYRRAGPACERAVAMC
jgi:tetratricopeptide (TPR) repeat protein